MCGFQENRFKYSTGADVQEFTVPAGSDVFNSSRNAFSLLAWLLRPLAVRSFDKENAQTCRYKLNIFPKVLSEFSYVVYKSYLLQLN